MTAVDITRYPSLRSVNPLPPRARVERDWNLEGARAAGAQVFAVIFGAAKRSLSLSMILMVCMGYGVVRPSLGQDIHKIMGMALVYFVSSAVRLVGSAVYVSYLLARKQARGGGGGPCSFVRSFVQYEHTAGGVLTLRAVSSGVSF